VTIPHGRLGGTLAVAVAACLFGTLGPVSRGAYDAGMTPLTFALWRASLGTLGLLAIIGALTVRGRTRFHWKALDRRTIAALGAAVAAGIVLNLAIFTAFGQMSIALALLGFYTYPALVAIGAVATGEERLTRGRVIALVLALLGMAVVVLGGGGGGVSTRYARGRELIVAGYSKHLILIEPSLAERKDALSSLPGVQVDFIDSSQQSWKEAQAVRARMLANGWRSVLVVSDPPHMLRVKYAWASNLRGTGLTYTLIATNPPWWSAWRWWSNKPSSDFVRNEVLKLGYYVLRYPLGFCIGAGCD